MILRPGRRRLPLIFQSETAECGVACVAMVASYYGHSLDLVTLRRRYPVSLRGTTLASLIEVTGQLGLESRAYRLEPSGLGSLRLPCIIHWSMNHFVVLAKVGPSKALLYDPALGRRRVSQAEIRRCFTGIALELTPGATFVRAHENKPFTVRQLVGAAPEMGSAPLRILALAGLLEAFALLGPLLLQWVIDQGIASAQLRTLASIGLALALLAILEAGLSLARAWETVALSSRLNVGWLTRLSSHMLSLPVPYFEKRNLGDILSRFASADTIQRAITTSLVEAFLDGVVAMFVLVVMFFYSADLALLVACGVCAYVALRAASYDRVRASTEEQIVCAADQQTHMLETLRGISAIKLFSREAQRGSGWRSRLVATANATARSEKWAATYRAATLLIFGLEMAVIVWLAARLIIRHLFTIGMLFAFVAYKDQFNARASALTDRAFDFRMLGLQAERLGDIMLQSPEPASGARPTKPAASRAAVEARATSFRYSPSDPWVIRDFDLYVAPGECVAIVGLSGSGKSTLFKLMAGILLPELGEIFLGGAPLSTNRRAATEKLGVVLQNDALFAGSVSQNIHFFDERPDHTRVEECARLAAVERDITEMPMGYETLVGHAGVGISGGQKQRILIARALYCKPSILLLDEATSHLDLATERIIALNLAALKITRIFAAHRPETLAIADRVVCLGMHPAGDSAQLPLGWFTAQSAGLGPEYEGRKHDED